MSDGSDATATAYRSANVEAMLSLYDDDASIECGCGGQKIIIGKAAMEQYWIRRFTEQAALGIKHLRREGSGVTLAYDTHEGVVHTVFVFNTLGKITQTRCGQSATIDFLRPPPR
jgi:hypothetical protein